MIYAPRLPVTPTYPGVYISVHRGDTQWRAHNNRRGDVDHSVRRSSAARGDKQSNDYQFLSGEVVREIERYLGTHPNAADTVEGIAQSWLSKAGSMASPAIIRAALNQMVSEGRACRVVLADRTVLYRSAGTERGAR